MTTHSGYLAANPWRGVITSQLRLAISALNCVFEQVFAFRAGEESAAMAHVPRHTRRGRASGRLVACCADSTAMTHTGIPAARARTVQLWSSVSVLLCT
jgi:hypothetical protein